MVGLQLVGRVKSVAADQIAARLGNVDLQGLNKHTNDPLRVASKKDRDLRKQYIRRVSSAGSRWIFLLGKQVEIGHRPWGYESPPRQKLKSLPFIWLQPPRIFRHFPFVPVLCRSLYVICCFFWTQFGHKKGRAICFVDQIEIHTPITSAELRVAKCATGKTLSICIF